MQPGVWAYRTRKPCAHLGGSPKREHAPRGREQPHTDLHGHLRAVVGYTKGHGASPSVRPSACTTARYPWALAVA